jgi:H+/gluconate symporter-like permease
MLFKRLGTYTIIPFLQITFLGTIDILKGYLLMRRNNKKKKKKKKERKNDETEGNLKWNSSCIYFTATIFVNILIMYVYQINFRKKNV